MKTQLIKRTDLKQMLFIGIAFLLCSNYAYCHNEHEFTPRNTDVSNSRVMRNYRNTVISIQSGIDVPDGGITNGRIAIESDGNVFASDDLGAIPLGIAILDKAGFLEKVVHIGYNNNPNSDRHSNTDKDNSSLKQYAEYRNIMERTADVFRLNKDLVFDYTKSQQANNAKANLVQEINASSANNPLYIVQAGVMTYLYEAFEASTRAKLKYVTVITHSFWNNIECHDSNKNENILDIWRDFQTVKFDYITDQNAGFRQRGNNPFVVIQWMKNSNNPKYNWLYTCAQKGDPNRWGFYNLQSEVDVSDAGMFYYLVTGNQRGNFSGLQRMLTRNRSLRSASIFSQPDIKVNSNAAGYLTVNLGNKSTKIDIYTISGQLVYTRTKVSGQVTIPSSEIGGKGYYILKANNITEKIYLH